MAHPSSSAGTGEPVHAHVRRGLTLFIEQFFILRRLNRSWRRRADEQQPSSADVQPLTSVAMTAEFDAIINILPRRLFIRLPAGISAQCR